MLEPQDPHARDGVGPAKGELMSMPQPSSERGCLALSRPMAAEHATVRRSPAHAHTQPFLGHIWPFLTYHLKNLQKP